MLNFPLEPFLAPLAQNPWTYFVFGLIGFGFGFALEISGFGNSKKLAAQFYFKEMTVLKVMFTAIVTAMVLIFLSVGIGILDFNLVWVNPTYLGSGLLGGLIMGVGFIVGGFCPGTSLVAASTLKVDGIFFALGTLFGVWAFGETVQPYWEWWNTGGYFGRVTLMDVLHVPAGVVVVGVVLMALFMFWGGEQLERIFGKRDLSKEPRLRRAGAALLFAGALGVLVLGQPSNTEKWALMSAEKEVTLAERAVQIHPGELLASLADNRIRVVMLDVRPESDYNLFHIEDAQRVDLADLAPLAKELVAGSGANLVYVLMSNDEAAATEAWKILSAEQVPNVYILEGGVNNWLSIFSVEEPEIQATAVPVPPETLRYVFPAALGARYEASSPDSHHWSERLEYTPKIKLELKRDKSGGGCG
ncbi:MAG TPA: rhodanese-like domain-containing protein [Anaerolineales bacterium]|nr:rhodanese-like domain-containing protein [Anaerolineales bacterium]